MKSIPNTQFLISGSSDSSVLIWNLRNRKCFRMLKQHEDYVNSVNYIPSKRWIVSGSDDCNFKIWSIDNGKCIKTIKDGDSYVINI